jgi:hypothetical protein
MKLYRCTAAADDILRDGFRNGIGAYGTAEVFRGAISDDRMLLQRHPAI